MDKKTKKRVKIKHLISLLFAMFIAITAIGQTKINGVVVTITGEPLFGATVVETETLVASTTNAKGEFTMYVPEGSKLSITFIGYKTQMIDASPGMRVVLEEDALLLSDVVVTGYTTERKLEITGAVSVVKMEDINSIPSSNVMSSLQGRIPGVQISVDGTPGGGNTAVQIRGNTSINQATPLYIIDGMPTRSSLNTVVDPNDIESIQVLKDAASASIYGTQSAAGVVIITTKKAKEGALRVDFNATTTLQTWTSSLDLLNAEEWGHVYWEAYRNDNRTPNHVLYGGRVDNPSPVEFIDAPLNRIPSADTDWQKEVYQNAFQQNYNLSISRGTKNGSSALSFSYDDQDGIVKFTNFTRYAVRYRSDYGLLNNKIRIGENIAINKWNEVRAPGGIHELVIKQHPIIPVYDLDGYYGGPTSQIGDAENPVRLLHETKDNENIYWRIFGNIYAEIEPIKNLILRTQYSLNYSNSWTTYYDQGYDKEGDRSDPTSELRVNSSYGWDWVWSNIATYKFAVGGNSFNLLAGTEAKSNFGRNLRGTGNEFLLNDLDQRYLSNTQGVQTSTSSPDSKTSTFSIFGKVNYAFNEKYLASFTVRRDASSRFGPEKNYGIFPAASIGWRMSEENFMLGTKSWLDDLKFRASWGRNGNDQISSTATYTLYSIGGTNAVYDLLGRQSGTILSGIYKSSTGNPTISYEVTTQTNVGLDFSAFKQKLLFTFDWYTKETTGMLRRKTQAAIMGEGTTYYKNSASMENKGVELALTWRNSKRDFSYEVTFTGAAYKNRITYLDDTDYYTWGIGSATANVTNVGYPANAWLGYEVKGLIRTEEDLAEANATSSYSRNAIGRMWFVDQNGDNEITTADQVYLGTNDPKLEGGLNISLRYKRFDVRLYFLGRVGDVYNSARRYTDFFPGWTGNHGKNLLNAFHPETNPGSDIPALNTRTGYETSSTNSYYIEDGSFMKFKNMEIGFTLPRSILNKLSMSNCRFYLQAENIFTITRYSGADPELPGYRYPIPTNYTFGLRIGF
ncbi:MAG: TonB-dependent receptor [Bacteroidales bacterium]|nr:TonB-dependent receptor [Bacteroidales bacterium]